jgi:anti-sigma regulatory factor (Ser/Thr protein kinase)
MNITVNEEHAFHTLPRYFSSPVDAVREAIQNAYRAGCPNPGPDHHIDITIDGDDLTIQDNGIGIDNPENMLGLMFSRWRPDVAGDQDPAGLGVCALLAYSKSVRWISTFGSIEVEGKRFFDSKAYRDALEVSQETRLVNGTLVVLRGVGEALRPLHKNLSSVVQELTRYFVGPTITINGVRALDRELGTRLGTFAYNGGEIDLYYEPNRYGGFESAHNHGSRTNVNLIWHGQCIPLRVDNAPRDVGGWRINDMRRVRVVIRAENVITPKLPDRNDVVRDERTTSFLERVYSEYVKFLAEHLDSLVRQHRASGSVSYDCLKDYDEAFGNVVDFKHRFLDESGFALAHLFDNRRDDSPKRATKIVNIKDIKGCVDDSYILVNGEACYVSTDFGGLYLGSCTGGGARDPMSEAGFYSFAQVPKGVRTFTLRVTKADDTVARGPGYEVGRRGFTHWTSARFDLVEVDQNGEVVEGGEVYDLTPDDIPGDFQCFTSQDLGSDVTYDAFVIGDLDEARRFYLNNVSNALSDGQIDTDGESHEEYANKQCVEWNEAIAGLDGVEFVSDLYALSRMCRGGAAVVNFDTGTVTVGDTVTRVKFNV